MKEYKFVFANSSNIQDILNEHSSSGWVLKTYVKEEVGYSLIFERNK